MRVNWRLIAVAGVLPALLGSLLAVTPFGVDIEQRFGLDILFKLRGPKPPPDEVVVVAVDRTTSDQLGAPEKLFQWSRAHHARLLDALAQRDVRTVVFDLLFQEPRDAAGDQAFAEAIVRAGNVVLVTELWESEPRTIDTGAGTVLINPVNEEPPLPLFAEGALTKAPFVLPKVPEQVRQYWTFRADVGGLPSLPVAALHAHALPYARDLFELARGNAVDEPGVDWSGVDDAGLMERLTLLRQRVSADGVLAGRLDEGVVRLAVEDDGEAVIRALLDAWHRPDSRFINFYGGPRALTMVPYELVVQTPPDQPLPVDLAGKVVFVGFAEQVVQKQVDNFFTVFSTADGRDLAGVEIAATAFGNLLDDSAIRPLTHGGHVMWIMLWGIVLGIVSTLIPWPYTALVLVVASGAYAATAYSVFVSMHAWMPLAIPFVIQPLATLTAVIYWHYRVNRLQRERVHRALTRYLPEKVVNRVVNAHDVLKPGGERVFGVCLYTDAQRYTALAEQIDSENLNRVLNRYLETIFRPVREHNGWISDVTGDATMALWTAPKLTPCLAQYACDSALQIKRAVEVFNCASVETTLPTRISLHCGEFTLGNVGIESRLEYRGVGDVVNTVTRIDGVNKLLNTTMLATKEVVVLVNGIVTRDLGCFRVVGKKNVISLYEIVGAEKEVGDQVRRCLDRFALALDQFQLKNWCVAAERFTALRACWPGDGPTEFYWRLSCEFVEKPPPENWDGVVEVPEK